MNADPRRNLVTTSIFVLLALCFVAGAALAGYFGYRLIFRRGTQSPKQLAVANTATPAPQALKPTATVARTTAPTTVPTIALATSTPAPTHTPAEVAADDNAVPGDEGAAEVTPAGGTGGPTPEEEAEFLPQTGLGLIGPMAALALAGLAGGLHWLRRRR